MKNRFNLQMFADDPGDGAAEENQTGGNNDLAEEESSKKTYTDEEVDKIIERKMAEWQKKQEKAAKKQAEEQQKADEAQKLKEMNDQQKAEYEVRQLREELASLKQKDARSEMLKTARSILADKDIRIGDELISMMISEDADETNAAVTEFADAFQAAVNKAVKDALKGETPKKGSPSGSVTKEQIMAIKNRTERQRMINEHMDLFT